MRDGFPEPFRELCEAIGFLSLVWAGVEYTLDNIIYHVHERHGGRAAFTTVPRSLSQKTRYIRKAFATLDALREHEADAIELMEETSNLADQRHWCIHGVALNSAELTMKGPALFRKTMRGDSYWPADKKFTIATIDSLALRSTVLQTNLVFFSYSALGILTKDQINELLSTVGVQLP